MMPSTTWSNRDHREMIDSSDSKEKRLRQTVSIS